jgi:CRISPR system Cascade subunit CasA
MHVSGYDMDKMKARCWYETTMPVFVLNEDQQTKFAAEVQGLVDAAGQIAANLTQAVRDAWFDSGPGRKGPDTTFLRRDFLAATEPRFFDELAAVHDRFLGSASEAQATGERWHRGLCRMALEQFDRIVGSARIEHEDPKKYAKARANLIRFNNGKKIKDLLGVAI